jgi:hypothetical protein
MVRLEGQGAGVATFVGCGELSPNDLIEVSFAFLDSSATALTLIDLTKASLGQISGESMRVLARRVGRLAKDRGAHGKAAIICSSDVDFGMARMFATVASIEGLCFAVFPGPNSARGWLRDESSLSQS